MFKKVEYAGFEGHPELEAKAKQLTPVLAEEIGAWRGSVEVRCNPTQIAGAIALTLALTLPNGIEGEVTGTFVPTDFASARRLAHRCLRIWSDLLGVLLDKQHQRVEEFILAPAEA
jgi:hypothetical protein